MTPFDLWKSFVDSFAALHDGVHRKWIVERGTYPVVQENEAINALIASLTLPRRELLASMLVDAREGGVHDALVVLHDRLALNEGAYSEGGVQMEFEPVGNTLYQDYVARRAGYDWPE